MSPETPYASLSPSCLVQVRSEATGLFTASLVGQSEFSATAPTREEAVDLLRKILRQRFDDGSLVLIDVSRDNPLMQWFGHAKDDPNFDDYLNEIRKFREEMDLREKQHTDPGECPDTSLTPTT
jgi:hypothetical protein